MTPAEQRFIDVQNKVLKMEQKLDWQQEKQLSFEALIKERLESIDNTLTDLREVIYEGNGKRPLMERVAQAELLLKMSVASIGFVSTILLLFIGYQLDINFVKWVFN